MAQALRLLFIDDDESDVLLIERLLQRAGLDATVQHLADPDGLEAALTGGRWDAILLDYVLPGTEAPEVLRRIRAFDEDLPVIVLSGRAAEQDLVGVMKAGAQDYILKSHTARLVPALQREVAEAARRREQHALKAQLEQSRKMESVGRLAGGIAHDFNNLLGIIGGYAELAGKKVEPDHPLQKSLQRIQDAAQSASGLSRQLLAFSRRQIVEPAVVDLGSVVDNVYSLLARVLGNSIGIEMRREPGLNRVRLDPVQLEQVLINLAVNARDAMPDGGHLTLSLSNARIEEGDRLRENLTPGDYVVLTMCDTGRGTPDMADESQIFEPFFATRATNATFGLTAVRAIVRQSGGRLYAHSEPNKGTTFWLYFPRCDQELAAVAYEAPLLAGAGAETILLVEDQAALREVTRDVLETGGYRVLSAPDSSVAIEISERHRGPIELLVTEMTMPRMQGPELAQALVKRRPTMKVLFLAGSGEERSSIPELATMTRFVPKPVTFQALSRAIRELLVPEFAT
jgi:two-component system, cell cycle sensor histidine kinase and response regulator CckA